jgi:hypothetical protein
MDELDRVVDGARDMVAEVVELATAQLSIGADPGEIQSSHVVPAIELMEEIEARALLAAEGDYGALAAIRSTFKELKAIRDRLILAEPEPDQPEDP